MDEWLRCIGFHYLAWRWDRNRQTIAHSAEAPRFEEGTDSPIFSQIWSPLGLPCASVPVLEGPTGLPIGIQFLAPLGEDARALTHANWVHQQLGDWT